MNSDNTTGYASSIMLGCIADDFTGATDLANNLVRAGMRVVQTIGVPTQPLDVACDAVVVALKSRTIAPEEAVALSLAALRWLSGKAGVATVKSVPRASISASVTGPILPRISPV